MLLIPLALPLVTATVALQPLHGPYASATAACGEAGLVQTTDYSAFCRRQGLWQVALRNGDEWFIGPLPVQDGVTPGGVDLAPKADASSPPLYRVRFAQHAFSASGLDVDGQWVWPCIGGACTNDAVPVDLTDRSNGGDVQIGSDVVLRDGAVDVVFWKLRILGDSDRAVDWRVLVEQLRGHHAL